MARPFVSFTLVLAMTTQTLLGAGATSVSAQQPASPAASKPKYAEVQEAYQLLVKSHDMQAALAKLEEASRKYPELPSAHVLMYRILDGLGQPEAARLQLEDAIKADRIDPLAYIILGDIALQARRLTDAEAEYDKAKALLIVYTNKGNKGILLFSAMSGIAAVAERREEWKEAESRLRDLLNLEGAQENLVAQQRLARALFQQGKAAEAYETLKKAKKIDRDIAKKQGTLESVLTPEAIMAQYFDQNGGPTSATEYVEKWFNAALKMAPNDLETRRVVALWALEKGKLDFAKEQAEAALKIEAADAGLKPEEQKYKGSTTGRKLRGYVALWQKKWSDAEKYFEEVIFEHRDDLAAKNNIALALVEQDDPAKKQRAMVFAEGNYRDNNQNAEFMSTLGWVYFRLGRFDQADTSLALAMKVGGRNNPDTATYWAHCLDHRGRRWEAKEILDSVLKRDRHFSMRPQAQELYAKVKDVKNPEAAPTAKTP